MTTTTTERPPREKRAPEDPKIRARRIEVQRDAGRRRLRRVLIAACIAGILAGVYALTLTPLLDVDEIRVDGASHTGTDAVLAAIDIRPGDALLTADVGAAADALAELPWVERAEVRRAWPGAISVEIVERTPLAAIAAKGGGWVLVDRSGRQVAHEAEPALDLVRVAGLRVEPHPGVGAGDVYDGALDLAAVVPASLRGRIAALWPQEDGSVEATVTLGSGVVATARFGAANQLEKKLVALAAVLERADLANVRVIDLRVPDAPALTRG